MMENRSNKDFIIFIHIQKAAGTSFHHILRQNIPFYLTLNNHLFWAKYNGKITNDMFRKLMKRLPFINSLGGHTLRSYFNYEEFIDGKNIKYITFLRDPISRYISQYNYARIKMNENYNLDTFLAMESYNNFQTKKIAGINNIELAKNILNKQFEFVGIVEEFDKSLKFLKRTFPNLIKNIQYGKKRNITPKESEKIKYGSLTKDVKNQIIENNKLDIELYNYAKNRFSYLTKDMVDYRNENSSNIRNRLISIDNLLLKILFEKLIIRFLY